MNINNINKIINNANNRDYKIHKNISNFNIENRLLNANSKIR